MRIALLYNPTAGEGHAFPEIFRSFAHHGHELVCVVANKAEAERLVERPCDLVVAAGGDGTIAVVARVFAGRGVPMAIVPLGTANNTALSLGIEAPIEELMSGWRTAGKRPLDLGIAQGPWGQRLFLESVGVGLIPAGIAAAEALPPADASRRLSTLARTAQIYRDALSRLQPQRCTVTVDRMRISGDFLFIEALNVPFVGPNLVLAAEANPSDGLLSVAFARADQRAQLDEFLRHRLEGTDRPLSLEAFSGRSVEIDSSDCLHVDDKIHHCDQSTRVTLHVKTAALEVLV